MICSIFLTLIILQLQGIQYHLDILRGQGKLDNYKCKDIDITKWRIIEYLEKPIQKDRYIEQPYFIPI